MTKKSAQALSKTPDATKLVPDSNGILTVSPLPTVEEVRHFYQNTYYQDNKGQYTGNYTPEQIEYFHYKDNIFHHFLKKEQPKAKRMLDIGCGEGFALRYFTDQGFECSGGDFSISGITQQNPDLLKKISFFHGDIVNDDYFEGEIFDCITCHNVLEHVIDFYAFMKKLHNKLTPGGLLFAQVPNEFGPLQNAFMARTQITNKEDCPWYCPPEHIRYFSPQSFKAGCEAAGFKTLSLMGDFPIDMFLLDAKTDYYNGDFGKTAHSIRVKFQNILSRNVEANIQYAEALAELGIGREVMGVFKKI